MLITVLIQTIETVATTALSFVTVIFRITLDSTSEVTFSSK